VESDKGDSVQGVAFKLASKAEKIDQVLVIYHTEKGMSTLDNGLTIESCLFLMEACKHWMMSKVNSG